MGSVKHSGPTPGTPAELRHRTGVTSSPQSHDVCIYIFTSYLPTPRPPLLPRHPLYDLLLIMPDPRPIAAAALQPIRNVVSASFLYPFKGIYYFLSHREYWPLFGRQLIPLSVISLVILGLLFTFTYVPQALFLLIFHGPTAWFNAVFLVLGEGQILVALLFEAFMVDETLVNVFDVRLPVPLLSLAGSPSLTWANLSPPGNTHPRRPHRLGLSYTHSLPRCPERCQDARQTHHLGGLLALLFPPDSRIHTLPPSKLDTRDRHTVLPTPDWSTRGPAPPLEIFQTSRPQ